MSQFPTEVLDRFASGNQVSHGLNLVLELDPAPNKLPLMLWDIFLAQDKIKQALETLSFVHFARFVPSWDVEICRQLDGVPLALEFAAARVPVLGLAGVRERLHDRLRLLSRGPRTAPSRHSSLQAALEWSHQLLPESAQTLLHRLSVFRARGARARQRAHVAGSAECPCGAHLGPDSASP